MAVRPEYKAWAAHLRDTFPSGEDSVRRYADEREENRIDIFIHKDDEGIVVATIGLMQINQSKDDARPIFTELLLDVRRGDERAANIISTAGFFILKDGWRVAPDVVFEDIVTMYLPDAPMKHLLFVPPYQWEGRTMTAVNLGALTVHPLLAVPISDGELQYVNERGAKALRDLWERTGVDVLDLERVSAA